MYGINFIQGLERILVIRNAVGSALEIKNGGLRTELSRSAPSSLVVTGATVLNWRAASCTRTLMEKYSNLLRIS